MESIQELLPIIIGIIDGVAIGIVLWGVIVAVISFVRSEIRSFYKVEKVRPCDSLRLNFGAKLVLSLEFFLAGDIIRTVDEPSWNSIGLLAALIVIRTVLSYLLTIELKEKESH